MTVVNTGALKDIRVVELGQLLAGPFCGQLLGDMGAEVIKIEQPGGDPIRGFFDSIGSDQTANPVFELDNRGKKSIVLDTSKPAGREAVIRLIQDADIFLTNVRPAALKRGGALLCRAVAFTTAAPGPPPAARRRFRPGNLFSFRPLLPCISL